MSGKRVSVTLDDGLHAALAAYASAQDRTPANVLRHALRGYLSRFNALHPKTQGRANARTRKGMHFALDTPENAVVSTKGDRG